jgi:beta-barrel assembly-enhancing protease
MKPDLWSLKPAIHAARLVVLAFVLELFARADPIPFPQSSSNPVAIFQSAAQDQDSSNRESEGGTPANRESAPVSAPVVGDIPANTDGTHAVQENAKEDEPRNDNRPEGYEKSDVDPNKVVEVGSERIPIKPGSIDDVNAVGTRNIGGRGMGNWYSIESEIKLGRQYASEIEKNTRFVTDPVVSEYVNRIGQNIVKNSDCKVPFTIRVIDSNEVNAMALPGGFLYMNSGLILSTDEEAEMAGVMAHEIAHVCAHHAARQLTRTNYTQLGMIPVVMLTGSGWTAFGIYEATQFVVPLAFLKFSRSFEAEADYLGIQYAYRTGYDPQAIITFFEKIQALEKRKPGAVSKAFSAHPQTPDRIVHSQQAIARVLPAREQYVVTTSEFDDVKARLARIQTKRRLIDPKMEGPSLRRASAANDSDEQKADSREGRPTLQRREQQED